MTLSPVPPATSLLDLPAWAVVGEKRRQHIARVTALLEQWAVRLSLDEASARAWRDAGLWHDALRDAPHDLLRQWAREHAGLPTHVLHGPAAAARLEAEGERRPDVLSAIRWHTLGEASWNAVGRALYMADFLDPGRQFAARDRAWLAAHVPDDFEGTFRQVVRMRLEWTLREGKPLFPQTVALWNAVH